MSSAARHPAAQIWESVLGQLMLRVTRQNYENWLRNTFSDHFEGTVLVVSAPSELARDWLATRMKTLVSQTLTSVAGPGLGVRFDAAGPVEEPDSSSPPLQPALLQEQTLGANPRLRFDSFIAGAHNEVALAAALDVANNLSSPYSPLFITGQSGNGKTHLLHAIAHQNADQGLRALLINADQFVSDFTGAVRSRTGAAFRAQYREVDLFLMDDAHVLVGKKASQIEFYQTMAALHDQGRRVVIAGDHHALIGEAATRFDSSLRWGLVATVGQPEIKDRIRFLELRIREHEMSLEPEVLHYIALRVKGSIRELEGAVNRVLAHARITAEPVTVDFAARALQPVSASPLGATVLLQPTDVLAAACEYLNVEPRIIESARRDRAATYARHLAMYLLRKEAGMTYAGIASLLKKADHSTVVHACSQMEQEIKVNAVIRSDLDAIRAILRKPAASS